jgi:hypothetical protein
MRLPGLGTPRSGASGQVLIDGEWPCQRYPERWHSRAKQLIAEFEAAYAIFRLPRGKKSRGRRARETMLILRKIFDDPATLGARDVGTIRQVLASFRVKRGLPGSQRHRELRDYVMYSVGRDAAAAALYSGKNVHSLLAAGSPHCRETPTQVQAWSP